MASSFMEQKSFAKKATENTMNKIIQYIIKNLSVIIYYNVKIVNFLKQREWNPYSHHFSSVI